MSFWRRIWRDFMTGSFVCLTVICLYLLIAESLLAIFYGPERSTLFILVAIGDLGICWLYFRRTFWESERKES